MTNSMRRFVQSGPCSWVLFLVMIGISSKAPAVEKFAVLEESDLIFTGTAAELRWGITFSNWRLMWSLSGVVQVNEVLKGPQEMRGKRIHYLFRCGGCVLDAPFRELPRYFRKESLWFVRRYGERWEAAWGANPDPCIEPLCEADTFRRYLRREPPPYPRICQAEDGR